ncbi:MAG TPA: trehalose-6-phosphate synthase [Rhodothermales bacterium]
MRLIVVANRPPIRKTESGWEPSVGGLATALMPVLHEHGGVWVSMNEDPAALPVQPFPEDDPRFEIRRVPLSEAEMADYYYGMANSVLWPISHYMLQHVKLERAFFRSYREINARFAQTVLEAYRPGDYVWIQDYHLMLAPEYIRDAHPDAEIGFFWHIPWPAMEVFRILPGARDLLRGMLACDVIGFHVGEYVENFLKSVRVLLGAKVDDTSVIWGDRRVRVEAHPIGIDVRRFEELSDDPATVQLADALRDDVGTEYLLVGIDRLDYTKGILSRLLAFEQLLQERPQYRERVTLYQIATPSRTEVSSYRQLKREVDEAVGRINGAFARQTWIPVRYVYRTYSQQELTVFYRAADVAMITPLRDGMNLVTQEFIAASRKGVLLLSELTGAAYLMPEALHVNPYNVDDVVRGICDALEMSEAEKLERLHYLKQTVARLDVHQWAERFLAAMTAS